MLDQIRRLHGYIATNHLHEGKLVGADQGVRWNIRVWRFFKSYFASLRPLERFYFIQGQAYWALACWTIADLTGEERYAAGARAATDVIRATQREDGAWDYPLRERRHLVATVEGDFGAIAMLEAYRREGDERFLASALRWHAYVESNISYQSYRSGLCINYFQKPRGLVPNNTCEWLWVLGRLATTTGDRCFLERAPALLDFLEAVQRPSGELPYELAGPYERRTRIHYLCFQYNAFQCMKLAWFGAEHLDHRAQQLALRVADFLAAGVLPSGAVRASCGRTFPEVIYYADAVAMALHTVSMLGWTDYSALADRNYRYVLSRQRPDGGFPYFSRRDYGVLEDRNDYPRYLAMTLYHCAERARCVRPL